MRIDGIDRKILKEIEKDGKVSTRTMAAKTGLSPGKCNARIKRMEDVGVIEGYTVRINRRLIGAKITAFLLVSIDKPTHLATERMRQELGKIPYIMECHETAGDIDYLLKIVAADIEEYRKIVHHLMKILPQTKIVKSHLVMETMIEKANASISMAEGSEE